MSAPLLLTVVILGVIVLHALSRAWRRNPKARLTFALRIPLASAWQGRMRSRIATLSTASLLMLLSVALLVFGSVSTTRRSFSKLLVAATALAFAVTCVSRWNTRLSTVAASDTLVLDEDAYGIFSIATDAEAIPW